MKKTIHSHVVECCDLCQRGECLLQTCIVCGRQYCLGCQGTVTDSYGFLDVCCDCADRDDVTAVCETYAERLEPIFQQRDAAVKRLGRRRKP